MTTFETLTLIHISFTVVAILSGITAMLATPKGNKLHRKAGFIYFCSYLTLMLSGILMMFLKFKSLFLSLTLFGFYLLIMGYRAVRYKNQKSTYIDYLMLIVLLSSLLLYLYDAVKLFDSLFQPDYGWAFIRYFFVGFTLYIFIVDFRFIVSRTSNQSGWLFRHMEKMLISFIPLIGGVFLRYSDYLISKEYRWTWWVSPYIICLPLVAFWISKYKPKTTKQK